MGNEQSNNNEYFSTLYVKKNEEVLDTSGISSCEEQLAGELLDQRRRTAHRNRARRTTFQMPSPDQQYTRKVQLQVPLTKIRLSIEERLDVTPFRDKDEEQHFEGCNNDNLKDTDDFGEKEEESHYFRRVKKKTKKYTKKYIKKGKKAVRKGVSQLKNNKILENIMAMQKISYHSIFHSKHDSMERREVESNVVGNIGVSKSPWKTTESVSASLQLESSESMSDGDFLQSKSHKRSISSDSSSVESSIAQRVKIMPVGATRASYVHPRVQNLKVQNSSQASSLGTSSFDSHNNNPYGAHGGLRLDKIISICSTITDDFTPRQGRGGPKIDKSVLSVIKQYRSFDEQSDAMPETPAGFDHLAEYDYQESLLKLQSTPASECSEVYDRNYFFDEDGLHANKMNTPNKNKSSHESSLLEKYLMTKRSMQERLTNETGSISHSMSLKSSTSALPPKAVQKIDRSVDNYYAAQNAALWKVEDDTYNEQESNPEEKQTTESLMSSPLCGLQHVSPVKEAKNHAYLNQMQQADSIDDSSIPIFSKKIEYVNKAQEDESVISFLTNSVANTDSFEREANRVSNGKLQLVEEAEEEKNSSCHMYQEESDSTKLPTVESRIVGYSPRAFAPKGSAFGVQLRRIENRKIDTAVPFIGDGVFPNNHGTVSQARDDQPQAPMTEKERHSEMRRLLPVSNFSTPPTPKNVGGSHVSIFNSAIEGEGTERSLENISESPSAAKRSNRPSNTSMKTIQKRASPPKRRSLSTKVGRRSSGMVAQRVNEINKRTSEGAVFTKSVTDYNGRLKKNRSVKYRSERRETNGEGVLAPRRGNLKNPLFSTPLYGSIDEYKQICDESPFINEADSNESHDKHCEEAEEKNNVNVTLVKETEVKSLSGSNDVMLSHSGEQVSDIIRSESIDSTTDCFDQELAKHIEDLEEAMNNLVVYEKPKHRLGLISPQQQVEFRSYNNDVDSAQGSVVSDPFASELASSFAAKKVLLSDFNKEEVEYSGTTTVDNSGAALPPRPALLRSMSVNSATAVVQSGSGYSTFGDCSPLSADNNPCTPCDKENSSSYLSPAFRAQESSSVNPQKMNIPGTPRELCLSPTQRTPYQASKWRQMAAKHGTIERSSSKKLRRSRLALEKMQSLL